jgi:hypothetical protein
MTAFLAVPAEMLQAHSNPMSDIQIPILPADWQFHYLHYPRNLAPISDELCCV